MPQSLVNNLVHLVTSTKHRQPWISAEHWHALWAYQAGILENWNCSVVIIGGVEDHFHALFSLSKNFALKKVVEEVKRTQGGGKARTARLSLPWADKKSRFTGEVQVPSCCAMEVNSAPPPSP